MQGHKRRRACRVHRHRRPLQTQRIRHAPRQHAAGLTGPDIAIQRFQRRTAVAVVAARRAEIDAGARSIERARNQTSLLQRLPCQFQHQPLLRIHRHRFARRDAEKARVKLIDIAQKPALARVALAPRLRIRVVERRAVPALRERADRIAPFLQQRPVALRILHPARRAARHRNNRDRLVARVPQRGRGLCRCIQLRKGLLQKQLGNRLRRRIIEHQRGRQSCLGPRRQLVADLHRHQ